MIQVLWLVTTAYSLAKLLTPNNCCLHLSLHRFLFVPNSLFVFLGQLLQGRMESRQVSDSVARLENLQACRRKPKMSKGHPDIY